MSDLILAKILTRALNQSPTPKNLIDELGFAAHAEGDPRSGSGLIHDLITNAVSTPQTPNDVIKLKLQTWLIRYDGERDGAWSYLTLPYTSERRTKIYEILGLLDSDQAILNLHLPAFTGGNPIINVDHEKWYDAARKGRDAYYGPSLISYLTMRGWTPQNLGMLDQATDDILGNLADPEWGKDPARRDNVFAGRGLVVGYVQSGKTTTINLTIAKAIDAGYRLIIVLGGMTDLLRRQTQRRLDKEVIGQALLKNDPEVQESSGYLNASDWKNFIQHPHPRDGVRPKPIERLTTLDFDFSKSQGAAKLTDSWVNSESSAKIVVIKKQKSRLISLLKEVRRLGENEKRSLSVLIIDDESDQASINTVNPNKIKKSDEESKKRTAINLKIIEILRQCPRSQYVGVTATPVSSCFIDISDEMDLYPRHFILPLSRPESYMGILDFHDLDAELVPLSEDEPQPKKDQHVRDIKVPRGKDDDVLLAAIDAFVIGGALKLYRRSTKKYTGQHHTFFYSDSTSKADHAISEKRIVKLWNSAGYSSLKGLQRLNECYQNDILKFSNHQGDYDYFPSSFEDLKKFISEAVQLIDQTDDGKYCVLVVNSDPDAASIDFDVGEIWKFVVGGFKLSRGYTIEGLTITYFRRKSLNEAALMQMGRWFGYRAGYRDLVRLWISREEIAKPKAIDIYDNYQSICIDEEYLRRKFLEWYGTELEDGAKLTPLMIRPLIELYDSRLQPVAKGQMWNAELKSMTYSGTHSNTRYDELKTHLISNEKLFVDQFAKTPLRLDSINSTTQMYYAVINADEMCSLIDKVQRPSKNDSDAANEKLFGLFLKSKNCTINEWVIILPQIKSNRPAWTTVPGFSLNTVFRDWKSDFDKKQLKTIGERKGRLAAQIISGSSPAADISDKDIDGLSPIIRSLVTQPRRGVLILYPTYNGQENKNLPPIMAYECILPPQKIRQGWQVRDASPDAQVLIKAK